MSDFFSVKTACRAAILAGVLAIAGSPVLGTPLVLNGSFENTTVSITSTWDCTNASTCVVPNWSTLDYGQIVVLPSWFTNGYLFGPSPPVVGVAGPLPASSPDGGNFVFSDADYHNAAITQTISGLSPGGKYKLSFYQALAQDTELFVTTPGPVSAQWQVSFGSSTQTTPLMNADGSTLTISNWALQNMTFVAGASSQVLSFLAIGAGAPPLAGLDGISLTAVPEPGSAVMLLMGLLSGGFLYRRTRWQRINRTSVAP